MKVKIVLLFLLSLFNVQVFAQWTPPSFISEWYAVKAMDGYGEIVIPHSLNEYPAKVDVQIKVAKTNEEFIFTGVGAAPRDDDYGVDFGGIVYRYNGQNVVLYTPQAGFSSAKSGHIAFTGNSTHFDGPSSARGLYPSGHARVRAWKTSDFPEPLFTVDVAISSDPGDCYKEQNHGSAILPDLVIAQVLLDDGYVSEGQGNIFQEDTISNGNVLSGVVFGYNQDKLKMWVPSLVYLQRCNGVVYAHGDGFGTQSSQCEESGTVTIKGYQLSKAFQTSLPAGNGINSNDTISFGNIYSIDTALVTVQVKQNGNGNGILEDLIFNGVGSAMPTSEIYSGVVYVYTNNSVLLYTPTASNAKGYMIYLGNRWGNGQDSTDSKSADVIVTVFAPVCPDPTVPNTSNTLTNGLLDGSVVQYSCACGYTYNRGSLTRTCSSAAWDGTDPVCIEQTCVDPGPVSNATYTYTGLSGGSTVTYVCGANFSYEAGNLERTCLSNGTWDGMPPVCLEQKCKNPGVVANATYTYTGLSVESTVTYSCVAGFSCKAGDLVRTCQSDNTWDGIPPVCQELKCNDPGSIYNATYNVTGLSPENTATYTCNPGNQQLAGDAERTCQADGTWSGIPIVCIDIPTGSVSVPVTHTPETLAESMEQTKKELTVDKKGTSSYYRRHTSAYDPRPSAFYIGSVSVPVTHTPETLAESMEQTKKELTVDKKGTSSYYRRHTSAYDPRPSALYIGTAGVVLLCSVVAALVLPDFITLFRHMRNFTDIYRN